MKKSIFKPSNILQGGNIILIANRMLYNVNQSIVRHNEQTAYLALALAKNHSLNSRCSERNLVLLSLFHTIGFFLNDRDNPSYNPYSSSIDYFSQDKSIESRYMYSCYYLEYMTPLKRDSIAIETFTQDFDEMMKQAVYQTEYRSIIYLAARISDFVANHPDENLPENLMSLAPEKLDPQFTALFSKINEDNHLVENLKNGNYRSEINDYISKMSFSENEASMFLKLLVYFLDFKSTSTLKHSIDTACISLSLGTRCGLSDEEKNILFTSAFLHDIGKIATAQSILESPGLLSTEDMNLMKKHVNFSKKILHGLVDPRIEEAVYRHHEKLNGQGYPNQIKKEEITLLQRILTVADITSALTQTRSYHIGYDKASAISIIECMTKNGELDERVTRILSEDYDEIMEEVTLYQNFLKTDFGNVVQKYYAYYSYHNEVEIPEEPDSKIKVSEPEFYSDLLEL